MNLHTNLDLTKSSYKWTLERRESGHWGYKSGHWGYKSGHWGYKSGY